MYVNVCVCVCVCVCERERRNNFTQKWKLCDNLLTFMFFQTHLIFTPLEDHISMGLKVLKNNLVLYSFAAMHRDYRSYIK